MTLLSVTGWMFVAAAAMAVVGAFLLWRGWRGKRFDDHPLCRKCGFDLFNKPTESKVCPECGSDLELVKAVVVGHKRRSGSMALSGIAVLIPPLFLLGLTSLTLLGRVDWQANKPVWWLLREANGVDLIAQKAALSELLTRLSAGHLTQNQVTSVVDTALIIQGQANRRWSPELGELVERARQAGLVSDDQWRRYALQSVVGFQRLVFSDSIELNSPVTWRLDYLSSRTSSYPNLFVYWHLTSFDVDGHSSPINRDSFLGSRLGFMGGGYSSGPLPVAPLQNIPEGEHAAVLRFEYRVTDADLFFPPSFGRDIAGMRKRREFVENNMRPGEDEVDAMLRLLGKRWITRVEIRFPVKFTLTSRSKSSSRFE